MLTVCVCVLQYFWPRGPGCGGGGVRELAQHGQSWTVGPGVLHTGEQELETGNLSAQRVAFLHNMPSLSLFTWTGLQHVIMNPNFHLYRTSDIHGVVEQCL